MVIYYMVNLNGFNHQYDYLEDAEAFYEAMTDVPENEVILYQVEKVDISY